MLKWTEAEDIALLEGIEAQEVNEADEAIDLDPEVVGNDRTKEENESRWNLLLKGLCSVLPGQRYRPSATARKMIDDIKSFPQKYVQWAVPKGTAAKR